MSSGHSRLRLKPSGLTIGTTIVRVAFTSRVMRSSWP
jgi:hypothetical protein